MTNSKKNIFRFVDEGENFFGIIPEFRLLSFESYRVFVLVEKWDENHQQQRIEKIADSDFAKSH